jgi:TonB family protein
MKGRGLRVVVRLRATGSRLVRYVYGSAAAHGVAVAVILLVPMTRHRAAPDMGATVVALAGPIGGSTVAAPKPAAAAPAAPKAPPAPAPKEAHAVKEVPVPKPKTPVEKPKKPPTKPDATKEPEAEPQATPPSATPESGHGGGPAGAHGAGPAATSTGVTASLGSGDPSLGWYGAAVKAALESAWIKPYLEDQGQVVSVVVAFDIARNGTTRNLHVVTSSGVPSLDRSALRAVMEASPLPALPPTWSEEVLPATMRFDLNPEAQ